MTKTNKETKVAKRRTRRSPMEKACDDTKADAIASSKAASPSDGDHHLITSQGGDKFLFPTEYWSGDVRKATRVGQSFAAAKAAVEAAMTKREKNGLAKGLDARNAPHSHKALGDDRARAKTAAKADAAQERGKQAAEKKAARKAERSAKAVPKADDNRKITIVDKNFTFGREGTARNLSWLACKKAKTVAEYAKAGGALKYLPRWVSAGAIKLG